MITSPVHEEFRTIDLEEVTMWRTTQRLGRDQAAGWHEDATGPRRTALFEGRDGAEAVAVSRLLGQMDIDTMWCSGPDGSHVCPLVEDGHCELMDKADFVINNLGTANPRCAAVARAVNDEIPGDKPVAVVTRVHEAESVQEQLPRCIVVEGPLSRHIVKDVALIE